MNHLLFSKASATVASLVVSVVLLVSSAAGQTNYYFDPGASDSGNGSGASQTTNLWDTGVTSDWYDGTDTTFPAGGAAIANFDGVGGTVTVDGTVEPSAANFDGSTPYTVSGTGTINYQTTNGETFISNSGSDVDIEANSQITEGSDTNSLGISNSGAGNLTIGGTMAFLGSYEPDAAAANQDPKISININNSGGGTLNFSSTVTNVDDGPYTINSGTQSVGEFFEVNFESGTSEFDGDITSTNTGFDPNSGSSTSDNINVQNNATLLVDDSKFDRFQVQNGSLLINSANLNVTATNSFVGASGGTIGSNVTGVTQFSGRIANFSSGIMTLTAAAGGIVNFSGELDDGGVTAAGSSTFTQGTLITGPGIVEFSGSNYYAGGGGRYGGGGQAAGSNYDIGTEIASGGTLLIANTSGSATGGGIIQASSGGVATGLNDVVQLNGGGTLAGTGYAQQEIIAAAATSVIAPGGMDVNHVSSIGTLHLDNGLSAVNGLTANFTLAADGTGSQVELSNTEQAGIVANGSDTTPLTLDGPVTINLTGTVNTSDTYTLFYSKTGTAWDIGSANFSFNGVPTGYTAHEVYVADDLSNGEEELNVDFSAAPEPSTWALMGLGAVLVFGSARFRKLA